MYLGVEDQNKPIEQKIQLIPRNYLLVRRVYELTKKTIRYKLLTTRRYIGISIFVRYFDFLFLSKRGVTAGGSPTCGSCCSL